MRLARNKITHMTKRMIASCGVDVRRMPSPVLGHPQAELKPELDILAAHLTHERNDVFFVQVGANDGKLEETFLPIAEKYGWSGIVVEPQPDAYRRLCDRVAGMKGVVAYNVAIDHGCKERTLYCVDAEADVPAWVSGSASFDRDHLLACRTRIPNIGEMIIERRVACISFDDLMADAGATHLEVLQIDAEGYDLEVLKLANIEARKPSIVRFEHLNLSRSQWNEAARILVKNEYALAKSGNDTIGYRRG